MTLSIDMEDIQRVAKNLNAAADQIPYAMMIALNDATEATRTHLIKVTWPGHIKQRNASFISAALTTKGARATKKSLSTEIYENPTMRGRGNLMLHAKGGTRTPKRGSFMAIPTSNLPRGPRGVPPGMRPKALLSNPKKVQKGEALYVRQPNGRLKLVYVLKTATRIPKRVPFYEDYNRVMRQQLNSQIPKAFAKAMATRRAR